MKKRTLVIGDIHGNFKGLTQALERANFDNDNDTLISLGDLVDGHTESFEVVETLTKIKNLIAIRGNHDNWFFEWLITGVNPINWMQGQRATGESYLKQIDPTKPFYEYQTDEKGLKKIVYNLEPKHIPESHVELFINQKPYYIDDQNRLFVHGGINRHFHIDDPVYNDEDSLMWDRDFWNSALSYESMSRGIFDKKPKFKIKDDFKEVFIGHTMTQFWEEHKPMLASNVWNMDTGGGWFYKISIMDVDTKEVFQSDNASELYPEFKGRK